MDIPINVDAPMLSPSDTFCLVKHKFDLHSDS